MQKIITISLTILVAGTLFAGAASAALYVVNNKALVATALESVSTSTPTYDVSATSTITDSAVVGTSTATTSDTTEIAIAITEPKKPIPSKPTPKPVPVPTPQPTPTPVPEPTPTPAPTPVVEPLTLKTEHVSGEINMFTVTVTATDQSRNLALFISCPSTIAAMYQSGTNSVCNTLLPITLSNQSHTDTFVFLNPTTTDIDVSVKLFDQNNGNAQVLKQSTISVSSYVNVYSGYKNITLLNTENSYSNDKNSEYILLWKSVGYTSDDHGFLFLQSDAGANVSLPFKDASAGLYISNLKSGRIGFTLNDSTVPPGMYRFVITNEDKNVLTTSNYFKVIASADTDVPYVDVSSDGSHTITWTSSGVSFCVGSSNNHSDNNFNSILSSQGSFVASTLSTGSFTYSISCQDRHGVTVSGSATIEVK